MPAKAYSYTRFSTPDQSKSDSYRRQTSMAEAYAAAHGLELDTELTLQDLGVSAFRGANARTGALGRFLRAIEDELVEPGSVLLVESLDRVSRQAPWDTLPVIQLIINAGVDIVTLADQKVYTQAAMRAEPMRILESMFIMIRANEESEAKGRRIKAVWKAKRQRLADTGKRLTSRAPAWVAPEGDTWRLIEDRAAVVRRIFEMTLQGQGQHRIAETLNSEGVPTFGKAQFWHRSYVSKIISNPAVAGVLVPHTLDYDTNGRRSRKPLEPIPGYFPEVISREAFDRAQTQLAGGTPLVREARELSNVLARLGRCGCCGSSMTRVSKGRRGGRPYLVCTRQKAKASDCDQGFTPIELVEHALWQHREQIIGEAPSGDSDLDARLSALEEAVTRVEAIGENAVEALASGTLSVTLRRALEEAEVELDRLHQERRALEREAAAVATPGRERRLVELGEALAADPWDRARINTLLRELLTAVVVDRKAGTMALRWRSGGETAVTFGMPVDCS